MLRACERIPAIIDLQSDPVIDAEGFRPNVGIILANCGGQVLWAKRIGQAAWQFPQGGISPGAYVASAGLQEQGVLNGGDMTPEAAFCKLHWLLAGGRSAAAVRADWSLNLSDERTL